MLVSLLDCADSFSERQKSIILGIIALNLEVIKAFKGEDAMLESLNYFMKTLPEATEEILLKYIDIKINEYSDYDQLIINHELNPKYALENLLRTQITSKQGTSLIYKTSS